MEKSEENTHGVVYIVATPIGNLDDISARAIAILKSVDKIATEDTRHSQRLLKQFAISTPCVSYHDHSERQMCESLVAQLESGMRLALISDAGTPLVNDPGYHLVRLAHERGIRVVPVPGPCAAIAALSAAGLPSDRFCFEGYLPPKQGARRKKLASLLDEPRTLILYESPHRIVEALADIQAVFGDDRTAVVARELTKKFETIKKDSVVRLLEWIRQDANQQKGEFVLLLQGKAEKADTREINEATQRVLSVLLADLPASQAAALAAKITGVKKNLLYQRAMDMQASDHE